MDLLLNSDEQGVVDATAGFLADAMPVARLHKEGSAGLSEEQRRSLAQLGWFGLSIDAGDGGHGMTIIEEMLVMREAGRFLAPVEALAICLAARVAAQASCRDVVEGLVSGETSVAIAPGSVVGNRMRMLGTTDANLVLRFDGMYARLEIGDNETGEVVPCLDKATPMAWAPIAGRKMLACVDAAPVLRDARLLSAAMQVGIAEAVTHMIVEYARIRETFGRPIGSYQAVRHPCAEMVTRAHVARAQLYFAAVCVRDKRVDSELQANAAKVLADCAAVENTDANIQLHGGIAVTDEHDAHLYMKRANLLLRCFGHKSVLREILGSDSGVEASAAS
jgi:alkylation response protein AidB-like acyl-CoA dehydrogenase